MRYSLVVCTMLLVAMPMQAQEPEQQPEEIQIIPSRPVVCTMLLVAMPMQAQEIQIIPSRPLESYTAREIEVKLPKPFRFSIMYEIGTDTFVPRFRYDALPSKIIRPTRVFTNEMKASRWRLDAQQSSVTSGEPMTRSFIEARGAPLKLGIFWLGLGTRYDQSSSRHRLYEGLDAGIVSVNQYRSFSGSLSLMIGEYNTSSIAVTGFYGTLYTADQLGLMVGSNTVSSLLDIVIIERSAYWGTGINGAARFWGIAFEASTLGYVPHQATRALPSSFVLLEGRLTYTSPWKLGVFASGAKALGFHRAQPSSLQSFNDRWTAGALVQLP